MAERDGKQTEMRRGRMEESKGTEKRGEENVRKSYRAN